MPELFAYLCLWYEKKMKLSSEEFDQVVRYAVTSIPEEIRRYLDNIVISVMDRATKEMREMMQLPPGEEPLGYFCGSTLADKSFFSPVEYPHTIYIFQRSLEEICPTKQALEEEIRITVIHEIAHFLGISDERLIELGYG